LFHLGLTFPYTLPLPVPTFKIFKIFNNCHRAKRNVLPSILLMKFLLHCVDPNSPGDNGCLITLYDIRNPKGYEALGLFPPILVRFWITMVYSKECSPSFLMTQFNHSIHSWNTDCSVSKVTPRHMVVIASTIHVYCRRP
jgi:hypothetical protein